jgi:hypothetical protein
MGIILGGPSLAGPSLFMNHEGTPKESILKFSKRKGEQVYSK